MVWLKIPVLVATVLAGDDPTHSHHGPLLGSLVYCISKWQRLILVGSYIVQVR